jgi:Zn-dependent membrane protease YugP
MTTSLTFALIGNQTSFLPSWVFMVLLGLVMIFSLYAQMRVSSVYNKNAQIPSRGRITGREAAEAVMARAGITDVEIASTDGHLTDHYDPINKRLVLSEENYRGTSLAALGSPRTRQAMLSNTRSATRCSSCEWRWCRLPIL